MITVFIVDDNQLDREGIHSILYDASDIKIVGEAEDGVVAMEKIPKILPQVILLDLKIPGISAAELVYWIRVNFPDSAILVLTAHDKDIYLAEMIDAGVSGYFDKGIKGEDLIDIIRKTVSGGNLFDESQLQRAGIWKSETKQKWEMLTKREHEILQLISEGNDNKSIAQKFEVTSKTVEKHLDHIYKKLGVTSRTQAVIWWFEKGRDFTN